MRDAGILGYGSVSAAKVSAAASLGDGTTVSQYILDYQEEYFDVTTESTQRCSYTALGASLAGAHARFHVAAQVSFTSLERWSEQLEQSADTLAAAHQTKLSYLAAKFSGTELESRVASLTKSYQSAKDTAADSVTNLLGRFLEPKDRAIIAPEIRSGVLETFARYEEKYAAAAEGQKDNSWLGATLYEGAVNLRLGTCGQYTPPNQNEDGSWDLAEYRSTSVTISAYQAILAAARSGEGTEARLLAKFSEVSMKAEAVTIRGRNPGAKELFRISSKNAYLELLAAFGKGPSECFTALA